MGGVVYGSWVGLERVCGGSGVWGVVFVFVCVGFYCGKGRVVFGVGVVLGLMEGGLGKGDGCFGEME